ncbi:MAG: Gfo/Idh/MocA family oxidoreductase [Flavobacteriales bacterium]|nr:MAG: Gfo/Idh/MocA family oxidoreductase [Flavobacteriales bacterium]
MSGVVRFAILGCGHIGKRHADLVQKHPEALLVATIDPLHETILQVTEFGVPHFKSLDDFLSANIAVDVINICTPNGLHASQAVNCLNHDLNVVIEKPIALTLSDADTILAAADKNGRHVFPVVQNRYSQTVKWLKEIVSEGLLGEIFMVQLNCFWNRDDYYYTKESWHGTLSMDGGPLFTQFSHFIDVLHWIFGDITNVQAKFSNFNHQHSTEFEDSGIISFDLIGGGVGAINYSTAVFQSNFESSITVIAANGTVKVGGQYMNCVEYSHVKGTQQPVFPDELLMNNYGSYKGSASNHHNVIDNVINVLAKRGKPDVSLEDGIKVVEIIGRIYESRNVEKVILEKVKILA